MPRDHHHPRPTLQREGWRLLDGTWDFAIDADGEWTHPRQVTFDRSIVVPFAPETEASGVAYDGFMRRCFYRTTLQVEPAANGERLVVHFGAVDREARVWANGSQVASHVGGYTPFSADITDEVGADGTVELVVRADDLPRTLTTPRGKQDWWPIPHIIWYPRTTGIWQSVWFERVPAPHVESLHWTGDIFTLSVDLVAKVRGVADGDTVRVRLHHGGRRLVDDTIVVADSVDGLATISRRFKVGTPGIDDSYLFIWRPNNPALLDATIDVTPAGATDPADSVASYAAIRDVRVEHGKVFLNGSPYVMRLALDQGYWPESGMTAPSVEALRRDVELIRELGLSGVRKHQKVEDPRWLAACDELGVLVWEEMPSMYPFDPDGAATLAQEWIDIVQRDRNHPCIVAWVPVNESWGVPDAVHDPAQQALIRGLAALTRSLDPTRLVSANDGWETLDGDIVGIHDYDQDAQRFAAKYATDDVIDTQFSGVGPATRPVALDGRGRDGRAVLVTEFGGATMSDNPDALFGYGNTASAEEWAARVRDLCGALLSSRALSGYCYTQLTDTYQEANGLLHMDRTPKAPMDVVRKALQGQPAD
jgi:beta-galactosidase/beta-glucuronidase